MFVASFIEIPPLKRYRVTRVGVNGRANGQPENVMPWLPVVGGGTPSVRMFTACFDRVWRNVRCMVVQRSINNRVKAVSRYRSLPAHKVR